MSRLPAECASLTHRLVMIPVREADEADVAGRHRIMTALATAHGTGRTVVVAWVRPRARGPVHVLVGGVEYAQGDEAMVAFPAGSRGRRLAPGGLQSTAPELCWEPCLLAVDAAAVDPGSRADRLEDVFAVSFAPMGLLVVARPLAAKDLDGTTDALSDEIARLEALRSGRGVHRRQLARAERNLEYYDGLAGTGWQLEVWAGGTDPGQARATAATVAGARDLAEVPLLVRPGAAQESGAVSWSTTCQLGTDAVAALARPPFRELPGLRVTRVPEFDQNVEDQIHLRLGSLLDETLTPAAPFGVSTDSVNRHVFVSGATGAGKSETVRSLLLRLNRAGVPWMVVEPAKAEYASLAPWLDPSNPMVVVRPGDPAAPPPMLNPLEPASLLVDGVRHVFPLQTHLDMVRALFIASFEADEPFPQILGSGLVRAYQSCGWNLVTGTASDPSLSPPSWPVLADLVRECLDVVESIGYAADVRSNMRGFIRVRVESLRSGTPGRFFEGGYPMDAADLLHRPVVFEIEDLGDDRDKAFFIGSLIIRLVELLRLRQHHGMQPDGLAHVLVIEEAHRLLRRVAEENPAAHAVTMFANLLAEIRSYGEGVVVAEQIPSKVIPDLVKNSAVKLMHRLPAEDDRQTVGATMNLTDDQSAHVVALEPGTAVAHSAGMDRPVLVRIDRTTTQPQTGAGRGGPTLGSRSPACPVECATDRCTLGRIESARDLVTPEVSLWAEQLVVAHLTGDPIGRPGGVWLQRLESSDRRRARCAVGLAVAASVQRRAELIRGWHDVAAFEADCAQRMAAQLKNGREIATPPWRWTVGQFTFRAVRSALRSADPALPTEQPHPRSSRWAAAGIDLPGPTWADQLEQLELLCNAAPLVRPWQLAGSPPVLDELARAMGHLGGTERDRIALAVHQLGLEHRWLGIRVSAG